MLNFEWLRTFRAVYITQSLSRAAEQLMISQPTVSQHISALESRVGKKLFERKSKGVIETDAGRMFNTMIASSIEALESIEFEVIKKDSSFKKIISIGISEHLYKSVLCPRITDLGDYVHIKFGSRQELIKEVERGDLTYAIIPGSLNTFDALCFDLFPQRMIIVGSPDIDFKELIHLFNKDTKLAEKWLKQYKWFAHDINSNFIKIYWLNVFNKKRPDIIPNYIIPNEYEILYRLTQGTGLSVAFDTTAAPFINSGQLNYCELNPVNHRNLSLIVNKQKSDQNITSELRKKLLKTEQFKRIKK